MERSRRKFLSTVAGMVSVGGLIALAGCSSSCPDSGRPSAEETLSFDAEPIGGFDTVPGGTWPTETGDAANTGFATGQLPESDLAVRWRTQLDVPTEDGVGVVASAPVVGSDRVFVADPEGVHALSLLSGALDWVSGPLSVTETERYGTYRPETIAPRVGPEGRVFVGLESGLVALDRTDGSVLWEARDFSAVAPPTIVEGTVIAQGEHTVRAFQLDGTERWEVAVSRGTGRRQPAAGSNTVVLKSDTGLRGYAIETGDRRWTRSLRAESAPVIDGGTCFLGTDQGLVGLDLTDGTDRFSYSRGDYMQFQSLVLTPETVYVVEQPPESGAASFALSRTDTGVEPRWCSYIGDGTVNAATEDWALGLLSLDEGPGSERSLAAFSTDVGSVPWGITSGSRSDTWLNPPAVLDGVLVLTTRGGQTLAVSGGD